MAADKFKKVNADLLNRTRELCVNSYDAMCAGTVDEAHLVHVFQEIIDNFATLKVSARTNAEKRFLCSFAGEVYVRELFGPILTLNKAGHDVVFFREGGGTYRRRVGRRDKSKRIVMVTRKQLTNAYITVNVNFTERKFSKYSDQPTVREVRGDMNVRVLGGFHVDIDVPQDYAERNEYIETITRKLLSSKVKPTCISETTGGLHAFYTYAEAIDLTNASVRTRVTVIKLHQMLTSAAYEFIQANVVNDNRHVDTCCLDGGRLTKIQFSLYQKPGEELAFIMPLHVGPKVSVASLVNEFMFSNIDEQCSSVEALRSIPIDADDLAEIERTTATLLVGRTVSDPHAALATVIDRHHPVVEFANISATRVARPGRAVTASTHGEYAPGAKWYDNYADLAEPGEGCLIQRLAAASLTDLRALFGVKQLLNTTMSLGEAQRYVRENSNLLRILGVAAYGRSFRSPVYEDRTPSAVVYRSIGVNGVAFDYVKHFASDRPSGDVIEMYKYALGESFEQVVTRLAAIYGITVIGGRRAVAERMKTLGYGERELRLSTKTVVAEAERFMTTVLDHAIVGEARRAELLAVGQAIVDVVVANHERMNYRSILEVQTLVANKFVVSKLAAAGVHLSEARVSGCVKFWLAVKLVRGVFGSRNFTTRYAGVSRPLTVELYAHVARNAGHARRVVGQLNAAGWTGQLLGVGSLTSDRAWSVRHLVAILGDDYLTLTTGVQADLTFEDRATSAATNSALAQVNLDRRRRAFAEAELEVAQRVNPVSFSVARGKSRRLDAWAHLDLDLRLISINGRRLVKLAEDHERRLALRRSTSCLAVELTECPPVLRDLVDEFTHDGGQLGDGNFVRLVFHHVLLRECTSLTATA